MEIPLISVKNDDWLWRLECTEGNSLPLNEILTDSLFYPASGLDRDPINYLKHCTTSFIYCDYGLRKEDVYRTLMYHWSDEYRVIHQRTVSSDALAPAGFRMPELIETDADPATCEFHRRPEFFEWFVLERSDKPRGAGRPSRLSVLYLGVDAVMAFSELYARRRHKPYAIAVIQPGHAFGGNYTNFEKPDEILGRLVLNNRAGIPDILIFGGTGDESLYLEACWPRYRRLVACLYGSQQRHLSVWTWRQLKTVSSRC